MKKLYEKNELTFALVWIAVYVAGTSMAEALSETIGINKLVSAVFHAALTAALFLWVRRNGLTEKYGLFLPRYRLRRAWFFIPLALVCLYKLVFSPALRFSATESILFVISMLCVGFLEELIFRGFLFRAIEKENLARPVIISSVTFGIGHIVNLLNGYDIASSLMQIVFAVAVGFLLVFIFIRTGSLVPCIVFHSLNNVLAGFGSAQLLTDIAGSEQGGLMLNVTIRIVLTAAYLFYVLKCTPKKNCLK